jgi:hypothetical protein
VTQGADAPRLRSVLTMTESSTGSALHSRCPDILLVSRTPLGVGGGCPMSARTGMPRTGTWLRPCPSGTASKRRASPALRAGEAFVLSQINPELVV